MSLLRGKRARQSPSLRVTQERSNLFKLAQGAWGSFGKEAQFRQLPIGRNIGV
ncbi:hypothetical protein [Lunatimonas salinarum]|uniref:hypothetical protein n=1 Tax=Lunatimonas salinarum TaxID=1774590 RepID=UPI001ADF660C|nr:hypothetical protein [Lunatimonas salinarum]